MKADPREPGTFPDLEKEFEPNILNSTVYMISMSLQVATFAINYRYGISHELSNQLAFAYLWLVFVKIMFTFLNLFYLCLKN